ncbi:hypothetical protein [Leptospira mayottensis]|uniref:hypothetical protein n=1 Tax=Leptospira mayottensis TaxID=1137606 RepID=UPI0020B1120F|nr:hypothetical protein [Leptospira mayottensis]
MQNPSGWTVQLQNTNEPYSLTGVDYEECRASYIPGQIQAELPAGAILGKDFNQIQVAETKWISFTIGLVSIQNPNMKFTVYSGENKKNICI